MRKIMLFTAFIVLIASIAAPAPGQVGKAQSAGQMILTQSGNVYITILNTITNDCNGEFGIDSPDQQTLISSYKDHVGETVTVGPYPAGTELVFYIKPWRYCGKLDGNDPNPDPRLVTYLSTGDHAHVNPLAADNSWRVDFEDLPSWFNNNNPPYDFDDVTLLVRLEGAVPDFKQDDPAWVDQPYDHTGYTIGQVGCALSVAADILNNYGGAGADPATLNTCMSRSDVHGYLTAAEDPACLAGDTANCNAGTLYWTKLPACSNPSNPGVKTDVMVRFEGKFNVGSKGPHPATGAIVTLTPALLQQYIDADLAITRPVILELISPQEPGGVHYVLAKAKTGNDYEIHDPAGMHTLLSQYGMDSLVGIVRYRPILNVAEQFNETVTVNVFGEGVNAALFDGQGRRTGYSPYALSMFNDVPDSGYYHQMPITNDADGQLMGSGFRQAYINNPVRGQYVITVYSQHGGAYNLSVLFQDEPLVTFTGLASGTLPPMGWARYTFTIKNGVQPVLKLEPLLMYTPFILGR